MSIAGAEREQVEAAGAAVPPLSPRDLAGPVLVVVGLVAACSAWGQWLGRQGFDLVLGAPPLVGRWDLRPSPWVLVTLVVAALALPAADRLQRVSSRALPWAAAATSLVWSLGLALSDGLDGIREPLTDDTEYLVEVPRVTDGFLEGFTDKVFTRGEPGQWATHVGGHPPGALLVFAGLARIGLGGPWPAALLCVAVGASAAAAAVVAVRAVVDEQTALRAAPFVALAPAAVWLAVSADALFLGVSAWGIALLVLAGTRGSDAAAVAGGLLMGAALFLTYGALPLGVLAVTAVLLRRTLRPLVLSAVAVLAVHAVFLALGFDWFEGLAVTLDRVADGAGGRRHEVYFLVANVAAFLLALGPAVLPAVRRLARRDRLWLLVGPALVAVALAELSGRSKGEVERIWLPFTPWLLIACARLPHPRAWLAVQVVLGVVVQLVLRSTW